MVSFNRTATIDSYFKTPVMANLSFSAPKIPYSRTSAKVKGSRFYLAIDRQGFRARANKESERISIHKPSLVLIHLHSLHLHGLHVVVDFHRLDLGSFTPFTEYGHLVLNSYSADGRLAFISGENDATVLSRDRRKDAGASQLQWNFWTTGWGLRYQCWRRGLSLPLEFYSAIDRSLAPSYSALMAASDVNIR